MKDENKKSDTLKTIFDFIEGQQDKKQKKIEEKKRLAEEKAKKEKRNLIIAGSLFALLITIGIIFSFFEEEEYYDTTKITVPSSASSLEGENYEEVISQFKNKGFTNIETVVLDDLITGWLTKDGEVESIEIDGSKSFSSSSSYENDVKIIITYHTFQEQTEEINNSETNQELNSESPSTTEQELDTSEIVESEPTEDYASSESEIDYDEANIMLAKDLELCQGLALGILDEDGNPTENGIPYAQFAYALSILEAKCMDGKLIIRVMPEFELLSEDDKNYAIRCIHGTMKSNYEYVPYTSVRIFDGNIIGNSKVTDKETIKWKK